MTITTPSSNTTPSAPKAPPDINDLPHPLTIYVSHRDRIRIVAALRRIHPSRAEALCSALGLSRGDVS